MPLQRVTVRARSSSHGRMSITSCAVLRLLTVSSSVHAVSSASVAVPGGQSTVGSSPGSGSAAPAVLRTLPTAAAMAPTLAPIIPASLNEEHDSSDSDSGSDGSEWDEHDSEGHTRGVGSAFKCSAVYSRPDKTHVAVYACTRNGRPSGDVRSSQTSTSLPPARLPPPPASLPPVEEARQGAANPSACEPACLHALLLLGRIVRLLLESCCISKQPAAAVKPSGGGLLVYRMSVPAHHRSGRRGNKGAHYRDKGAHSRLG